MESNKSERWQINKLGLVNFWYYDYEEIPLINGKLLLRGGNGSGKSVTLQSFIPLLLDGNRAPSRLDPFGTVSRKLDNYMLLKDGETERTAYLFLEFKKKNTENYITVGMGIKAQKDKQTDVWYFIVRDGKRVGKDINLKKKEAGHEVVLQKKQLKNIMESSGMFFDKQKEYMAAMNEIFFGFESLDDYEDLLKLIISIRAPKLSKDFKPTIMYEILNRSLKTLDDNDLKNIAEAMEHMDSIKNKVEDNKNALKSCEEIIEVFNEYNRVTLYNKDKSRKEKLETLNSSLKKLEILENTIEKENEEFEALQKQKNSLEIEIKEIGLKKELLKKENDFSKFEEKSNFETTLEVLNQKLILKKERLEDKKNLLNQKKNELSSNIEKIEYIESKIEKLSNCLKENLTQLKISNLYDDDKLKIILDEFKVLLNSVRRDIEQYEMLNSQFKELNVDLEEVLFEIENSKKEELRLDNLIVDVEEGYKEKILDWQEKNSVFKMKDKEIIELNEIVTNFIEEVETDEIKKYLDEIYYRYDREIQLRLERVTLSSDRDKNIERLTNSNIEFKDLKDIGIDILLISEKDRKEAMNFKGKNYGNYLFTEDNINLSKDGYYKVDNLEGKINHNVEKLTKEELLLLKQQLEVERENIPSRDDLFVAKKTLSEYNKNIENLQRNKEEIRNKVSSVENKINMLDNQLHQKIKDTSIEKNLGSLEELRNVREETSEILVDLKSKNEQKFSLE
ncbi:MAG: hypothetical protein ACRCYT_00580, partial [Cetobacterium sp.]